MPKYYAVRNGRNKGIYSNWTDCKDQVAGFSRAEYKSFPTHAAANAYMNGESTAPLAAPSYESGPRRHGPRVSQSLMKKSSESFSGTPYYTTSRRTNVESIYTDGSSLGNGKSGSRAGYGVFWGPGDSRNRSGPVCGAIQTNNVGELTAIKEAYETIRNSPKDKSYVIKTDSAYSMDSVTKWANTWESNGWKTSTGGPVQNKQLIGDIRKLMRECKQLGINVSIEKVKGHSNSAGNIAADLLARQGAAKRP